nr:hypothetical protein CFP56_19220 [Quercus suber]
MTVIGGACTGTRPDLLIRADMQVFSADITETVARADPDKLDRKGKGQISPMSHTMVPERRHSNMVVLLENRRDQCDDDLRHRLWNHPTSSNG